MEGWMWIPIVIGFFWLWGWIQGLVEEHREKMKQEAKEQVYQEFPGKESVTKVLDFYRRKMEKLQKSTIDTKDSDAMLQAKIDAKVSSEYSKNCPSCFSGQLLLRPGRYGSFFGCTNYPRCKYRKNYSRMAAPIKKRFNQSAKEAFTEDFLRLINKY